MLGKIEVIIMEDKIIEFTFCDIQNYLLIKDNKVHVSLSHIARGLGYTTAAFTTRLNKFTAVKNLSHKVACKLDKSQAYVYNFVPVIKVGELLKGLYTRKDNDVEELLSQYTNSFAFAASQAAGIETFPKNQSQEEASEEKISDLETVNDPHEPISSEEKSLMDLPLIIINGKKVISTKQLAKYYQTSFTNILRNFNNNMSYYQEEVHYFRLPRTQAVELAQKMSKNPNSKIYLMELTPGQSERNSIIMWTEEGMWLSAKSIGTDIAWDAIKYLIRFYFARREEPAPLTDIKEIFGNLVDKINETHSEVESLKYANQVLLDRIIKLEKRPMIAPPIPKIDMNNWRNTIHQVVRTIKDHYIVKDYNAVWNALYSELSQIKNCNLGIRLENTKQRALQQGLSKSKVNKINILDVIEEDQSLKVAMSNLVLQYYQQYVVPSMVVGGN